MLSSAVDTFEDLSATHGVLRHGSRYHKQHRLHVGYRGIVQQQLSLEEEALDAV